MEFSKLPSISESESELHYCKFCNFEKPHYRIAQSEGIILTCSQCGSQSISIISSSENQSTNIGIAKAGDIVANNRPSHISKTIPYNPVLNERFIIQDRSFVCLHAVPDGDCFYSSVVIANRTDDLSKELLSIEDQNYESQVKELALKLKKDVASFLGNEESQYLDFISISDEEEKSMPNLSKSEKRLFKFKSCIEKIASPRVWADEFAIQATAKFIGRPIQILSITREVSTSGFKNLMNYGSRYNPESNERCLWLIHSYSSVISPSQLVNEHFDPCFEDIEFRISSTGIHAV
jgi:ribosomal protein L37AE/L43A